MTEEIRTTSSTGGEKGVKAQRHSLLPRHGLDVVAEVFGFGAEKYADHNWRRKYEWSKSYDALQRHLTAWWDGEDVDPESGLSHLGHAGFHVLVLATWERLDGQGSEFDDRHTFNRELYGSAEKALDVEVDWRDPALLTREAFQEVLAKAREDMGRIFDGTPLFDIDHVETAGRDETPLHGSYDGPLDYSESKFRESPTADIVDHAAARVCIAPVLPDTYRDLVKQAAVRLVNAEMALEEPVVDPCADDELEYASDAYDQALADAERYGFDADPHDHVGVLGRDWKEVGFISEGDDVFAPFTNNDIGPHLKAMQDAINETLTVSIPLSSTATAALRMAVGLPRFVASADGGIVDAFSTFGPDLLPKRRPVDRYTLEEARDFEWPNSMRASLQRALDRRP